MWSSLALVRFMKFNWNSYALFKMFEVKMKGKKNNSDLGFVCVNKRNIALIKELFLLSLKRFSTSVIDFICTIDWQKEQCCSVCQCNDFEWMSIKNWSSLFFSTTTIINAKNTALVYNDDDSKAALVAVFVLKLKIIPLNGDKVCVFVYNHTDYYNI